MAIRKAIKTKIFFSYVLIGILLLVIFSGIVNSIVYNRGEEQIRNSIDKGLSSVKSSTDLVLGSLYEYMYDLYNNDFLLINAIYNDRFDKFAMYDIHKRLNDILSSSSILDSIYIYNKRANSIFSNISSVREPDQFYEKNITALIKKYVENDSIFMPRKVKLRNTSLNYPQKNIVSFIFTYAGPGQEPEGAMIVNISQTKLQQVINQSFMFDSVFSTFIINNKKKIISHEVEDLFNANIANKDYINRIFSKEALSGSFDININGKKSVVSFIKSNRWQAVFVGIANYDKFFRYVENIKNIILILTIVFVLVGITGILYFTKLIYSPLNQIIKKISGRQGDLSGNYTSEYNFISSSLENMNTKIQELQQRVSSYFPAKKNIFLKGLLTEDSVQAVNTGNLLANEDINLDGPLYKVVVLRLDSFYKISNNNDIYSLQEYINELIKLTQRHFVAYDIEIVSDKVEYLIIVVNLSEDTVDNSELIIIIRGMQEEYYDKYQFTFTAGIGKIVESIYELKTSYFNAVECTNYRLNYGKSSIITDEIMNEINKKEYQYPYNIEKKIIGQLKLANKEELVQGVEEFIDYVREFDYNEILLSFSQLMLMIIRTAKKMLGSQLNEDLWVSYLQVQNKLKYCDTFAEVRDLIITNTDDIINARERKVSNKNFNIVNDVKQTIEKSFADESLSVEKLADEVDLSANYLRNIFKNITGTSLSNYITQKRFEEAKKLLVETDYTAKKIALMVGFSNSDYFYYAFKKYNGKSATSYRRENKDNKR